MKISDIEDSFKQDFEDLDGWIDDKYQSDFGTYFTNIRNLYDRMQDETRPITDKELEEILTDVPLQMFAVSEKLNQLKSKIEVIKLRVKEKRRQAYLDSEEVTVSKKTNEANFAVANDEMLIRLYTDLADRVTSEISSSKELIMSAKKIWTSRREAENVANAAQNFELPDYVNNDYQDKTYIK
jgi:hypothetical protein